MIFSRVTRAWVLVSLISIILSGCASYRSVENSMEVNKLNGVLLSSETINDSIFTDDIPIADWWVQLNDPSLNRLIERTLLNNHDIRIALSSINESRALLNQSRLEYIPSLTTSINGVREQRTDESLTGSVGEEKISQTYQTGLNVSWEMDVFGRVRNQVKLSQAQLLASEADFHAIQLSLVSDVANTYLQLRGIQSLIEIADHSMGIQKQNLRLVEGFAKVGRGSAFDVARAKAQFELTAARLPGLEKDYRLMLNRLSVLSATDILALEKQLKSNSALPTVPASVAIGNAYDLLKRRPDIFRAEQALKGSIAAYNVQVADLYPRISLTGNFGFLSTEWSNIGKDQSETFRFSPAVHWAALDLTRVKTRIAAADARAQVTLAQYEKTVLIAVEETDNAFTRFTHEDKRRQRLQLAAIASAKAADIAQLTFEKGRGDLRDVLDAELVRLNAAQQLVNSEINILTSLVDIYRNLGGGWGLQTNSQLASN